jgi:hypothetical protein
MLLRAIRCSYYKYNRCFAGLNDGVAYTFKITDANGCYVIQTYTLLPKTNYALKQIN